MSNRCLRGVLLTVALAAVGCGGSDTNNSGAGGANGVGGSGTGTGGASGVGGVTSSSGGTTANGTTEAATGGATTAATSATGGKAATGGTSGKGGTTGVSTTGNNPTGGANPAGGATGVGGKGVGGATTGTGKATGGTTGAGGATTGAGGKGVGGATTGAGGKGVGGATTGAGGDTGAGGTSVVAGGTSAGGGTGVTVQLDQTHQTIQGFGINDTWAGENLPSEVFSTTSAKGLGLTILRIGMNDKGQDYNSYSTDISNVKAAGGKVIGSVWSPPGNCKSDHTYVSDPVNDGGHLLESCYTSWSDSIVSWAKGHSLYAMSIGNEPDFASCGSQDPCNGNYPTTLFTAAEAVKWVKVVGPKLQAAGIKVIAPEASEWIHNWSNISAGPDAAGKNSSDALKCGCFGMNIDATTEAKCASTCAQGNGYDYGHWLAKDADAWKAFDIMGVHEYDSQTGYAWPADVTDGKRSKEIWQTEMSGVKWWPEQGPSSDIKNGVAVAGWIHSALVVGEASAWLWWWYKAYNTDDNEGLLLKSGTMTKRYYTFGNYSKFVRPGQIMVDVTGNTNTNLLISAFKGASDGTVVVVAINKGTSAVTVPITIAGGTAPASCTPNVTTSSDDLKAGTAVSVSSGAFSASLAATSVTTFVCK